MERELPEGWVETTVGEVLSFEYGKSLPAKSREGDEYPVMGSNGEVGRNYEYLIEGPGIVVGRKGSYGEVNWVEEHFFPIDTTYYVQITEAIDLRFAYNLLKSCDFKSLNRSTAIPGLNRNDAYQLNFPLPPLAEQKRIVAKLDEAFQHLDTLKARLERLPELLKNFRQSVLTQAVTGKLTEDWREENSDIESAHNLLERISADRIKRYELLCTKAKQEGNRKPRKIYLEEIPLVDYGITTPIPETWTVTNIEYLAFVTKLAGFEYTKYIKFKEAGDIPVVRAQNVQMGKFVEDNLVYIDEEVSDFLERSQLYGRELLMVFIGAGTGNVCLAPKNRRWHLAPNVAKIDVDGVDVDYLNYYLQSSIGFENTMSFVKATAQPSLSMETIRKIAVQLPPLEEQKEIIKRVEALFAKADAIEGYYTGLKEKIDKLPQAILAKAFRGELVPQNPNDEPATVLLEKIKAAKAAVVKPAKGKKAKGGKQGELVL